MNVRVVVIFKHIIDIPYDFNLLLNDLMNRSVFGCKQSFLQLINLRSTSTLLMTLHLHFLCHPQRNSRDDLQTHAS